MNTIYFIVIPEYCCRESISCYFWIHLENDVLRKFYLMRKR